MGKIIPILFILLLHFVCYAQSGPDWTTWRGPNRNGKSNDTDWNPKALENGAKVLWKTNVGKGHATVAVKGKRLYTMGEIPISSGNDTIYNEVVYCLDTESGKEIWNYTYKSKSYRYPGPGATPVVDGNYVYSIGRNGNVFCFNAIDGRVLWGKDLISESLSQAPDFGFAGSPVIVGDFCILNAGQSGLALNKHTGKVIWRSKCAKSGSSTPTLFNHDQLQLLVIAGGKTLYGVDLQKGNVLWTEKWQADSDPTIYNDHIYLMGGHGRIASALMALKDNQLEIIWQNKNGIHAFQSPVIIDGYAYQFSYVREQINSLQCIDLQTGEIKWNEERFEWGSLIAASDKLIVIGGNGELIIAEVSPELFQIVSSTQLFTRPDNVGKPNIAKCWCWSPPVLCHGKLYVRNNQGDLVCVDMSS